MKPLVSVKPDAVAVAYATCPPKSSRTAYPPIAVCFGGSPFVMIGRLGTWRVSNRMYDFPAETAAITIARFTMDYFRLRLGSLSVPTQTGIEREAVQGFLALRVPFWPQRQSAWRHLNASSARHALW
jgi:hypothetical protein